jgi:hypothetical protein
LKNLVWQNPKPSSIRVCPLMNLLYLEEPQISPRQKYLQLKLNSAVMIMMIIPIIIVTTTVSGKAPHAHHKLNFDCGG